MARFYGTTSGQAKTQATRIGSRNSGLRTTCNGWNAGVSVHGYAMGDSGEFDVFDIYMQGGNNGTRPPVYLGRVRQDYGTKSIIFDQSGKGTK